MTKIGIDDYAIWLEKNCVKRANIKLDSEDSLNKEKEEGFKAYTPICKKYYPLILKPVHNMAYNICSKHLKIISFFCLICESHYCIECKTNHIGHSFIKFDEIDVNEDELDKKENIIKFKFSK